MRDNVVRAGVGNYKGADTADSEGEASLGGNGPRRSLKAERARETMDSKTDSTTTNNPTLNHQKK